LSVADASQRQILRRLAGRERQGAGGQREVHAAWGGGAVARQLQGDRAGQIGAGAGDADRGGGQALLVHGRAGRRELDLPWLVVVGDGQGGGHEPAQRGAALRVGESQHERLRRLLDGT